jgi:hypothetical protein
MDNTLINLYTHKFIIFYDILNKGKPTDSLRLPLPFTVIN